MKNKFLISVFALCISANLLCLKAHAQLPFTYTVDAASFSALQLKGGMTQVRLADLNQNGHLDIVLIGDHGSPGVSSNQHGISVFFGNGTGSGWTLFQNGTFGYGGCAVGDLNNDGKMDIAYSMHHNYSSTDFGNQLIEAAIGDGTGMNWTPWDDGLAGNGESWGMFGTDIGDIDNDGWLDIGSNSFGVGSGMHLYKNNGNGTWTQSYQSGSGNTGRYLQFGDMDGDGNLDFAAGNYLGSTFFGNGNGTFTLKQTGLPPLPNAQQAPYVDVSLTDIDNDGDDDFIFTYKNYTTGLYGVHAYKWNKNTQQWDDHSAGLPSASGYEQYTCARAADIDMDGFADIITTSDSLNEVQIYKGNGGNSWSKMYSVVVPQLIGAEDIVVADVDHSGYPEILLVSTVFYPGGGFPPTNPTALNEFRLLKDNVNPNAINAALLYPKGNECLHSNSVRFIKWYSGVPNNNSSSVKIEYSTTGSLGPWTLIAASTPNNGTYQWTVPPSVIATNCFIRITATDNVSSATAVAMNSVPFSMGCTTSATGLEETSNENTLNVFPNPFISSAMINSNFSIEGYSLYDITGKEIRKADFGFSCLLPSRTLFMLERKNLSSGIYILELRSYNSTERIKLVVN